jgi:hypothetical protein
MRSKALWLILVGCLAFTHAGKTWAQESLAQGGGALTVQDAKDKVRTLSHCKTLGYPMSAGKTYQIDMRSTELDPYLRLEDPAGQQVAFDDDGGGFPNARIIYSPKVSGQFTIVCTTYAGGSTGKFTLQVQEIASPAATATPVEPNPVIRAMQRSLPQLAPVTVSNFAINPPGPAVGSNYTVTASVHSRETGVLHAEIILPQGDRVVSSPADQSISAGATVSLAWTVYCGISGGNVRVQANLVRAAQAPGMEVAAELTANDAKDSVRTNSFAKTFPYKMEKGRTYQIDMKSRDFDAYLRLENPGGAQVAFDDDSGGSLDARIIHTAQQSGDFKIIATTYAGGAGKFTLTVKDAASAVGAGTNAPPAISVIGAWAGTESLTGFGALTFVFAENGHVTMVDAKVTVNGSWTLAGRNVTIRFNNCVYTGEINGRTFQGTAQFTQGTPQSWSFRLEKK